MLIKLIKELYNCFDMAQIEVFNINQNVIQIYYNINIEFFDKNFA